MRHSRIRALEAPFLDSEASPRPCDHPGCAAEGSFRAPRSRLDLGSYYMFCLDHVREYNAAWDYYSGMSQAEIEAELRADMVGRRPSWPIGTRGRGAVHRTEPDIFDFFDLFSGWNARSNRPPRRPRTPEEEALVVLGLVTPVTASQVKERYRRLVKMHHPDSHGGDKDAEERLKTINQAYMIVRNGVESM